MSILLDSILTNNNMQMLIGYTDNDQDYYKMYRNALQRKNIILYDKNFVIDKNIWKMGIVLNQYPGDNSLYLVDNKIYCVISNNNNSVSTVKPTSESLFNFRTDDGYVWRYVFSIQQDNIKDYIIASNIYNRIPIFGAVSSLRNHVRDVNFTNDIEYYFITEKGVGCTLSYDIKDKKIENLFISNGGNSYKEYDYIVITEKASGNNGKIDLNIDNEGKISINNFSAGGNYINPKAYVIGDGINAELEIVIANGSIDSVNVTNPGKDYTWAKVIIVNSVNSFISRINLEPKNGFGFINNMNEFKSKLLISKEFKVDIETNINYVMITSIPQKNEIPEIYLVNNIDKILTVDSENIIQILLSEEINEYK